MSDDYEKIRERVEKRFSERQGLIIHSLVFIIINGLLWGIYINNNRDAFPIPMMIITGGWGIGMVAHLMDYYYKYGPGYAKREQAIEREVERYRARQEYLREKPKREFTRLTEDGELETIYDESDAAEQDYGNR